MNNNLCMDYESGLRVAVWPQGRSPVCTGLSQRPIGCTPTLSVTKSAAAASVCGLWHYISDGPLPLPFILHLIDDDDDDDVCAEVGGSGSDNCVEFERDGIVQRHPGKPRVCEHRLRLADVAVRRRHAQQRLLLRRRVRRSF